MELMRIRLTTLAVLAIAPILANCAHTQTEDVASAQPLPTQAAQQTTAPQETTAQLKQLVAPIALYPDSLVGQILAASTYPTEIVEAERWMHQHPDLKGEQLGQEVDKQSWDPSVKALTQFPSVLANMDQNLSWTSQLGDAYVNQEQDVLNAVQVMRQEAQKAGNLKSTPQQTVTTQGQEIVIQPANPQVVYVPVYDPWLVYGPPLAIYPGWAPYGGLYAVGPGISFGLGFGIGVFGGFGWGWHHWDTDWHRHNIIYNHNTYISHSRTFENRNNFHGGGGFRGGGGIHGGEGFHGGGVAGGGGFHGGGAGRGIGGGGAAGAAPHMQPGTQSGAFSGFNHGGTARGFSSRGQSSFGGGGGGFHGGGGGFRGGGGGGGHGGGGHR